jgi:hypothetical protein
MKQCCSGSKFFLVLLIVAIYVYSLYYPPYSSDNIFNSRYNLPSDPYNNQSKADTTLLGYIATAGVILYMISSSKTNKAEASQNPPKHEEHIEHLDKIINSYDRTKTSLSPELKSALDAAKDFLDSSRETK